MNELTIHAYLKEKGLNEYGIAGLMGNLFAESGLKANNLQNSFENFLNMDDNTYMSAVDSGAYTNFIMDGAGWGICQWTYWPRKQALLAFAKAAGKSIGDLYVQLDFLWKELTESYPGVLAVLKSATSVLEASNAVLLNYEKPANQSVGVQKKRASYGQRYYNQFVTTVVEKGDAIAMKYSSTNPPMKCFMRQSSWYKKADKVTPCGVLLHSTGSDNTTLKRYVQPDNNAVDRAKMLKLLGENKNNNDWNREGQLVNGKWNPLNVGVHAFIGKLSSGDVTSVQVGDWDKKAWGCGSGKKGSCNNGWIQCEICEDNLGDPVYFEKVYREVVELTAYLCNLYGFDPHGTVTYNGVKVPVILCHQDSYRLGLGSNHGDVLHWFPKFGKSMQTVRDDVSALLAGVNTSKEEDEDMDVARFKELWNEMRKELQDNDSGKWSEEARQWATSTGLIAGMGVLPNGEQNYAWADILTREQMVVLLYRFARKMGVG